MGYLPEEREQILKLAKDGLSASQIARAMGGGRSRNAIIGVIHRAGEHLGTSPGVAKIRSAPKPRPPKVTLIKGGMVAHNLNHDQIVPAIFDEDGDPVRLSDAKRGMCRAIWGDVVIDSFICGRESGDHPYCPEHNRLHHKKKTETEEEKAA